MKKIKIGIVGGTGLLAGYLIHSLQKHPYIDLSYIDSLHDPDEPVSKYHKNLNENLASKKLDQYSPEYIKKNLELVFIAKPHSQAMKFVKDLYDGELKIIDLSGDFRIKDVKEYEKWYKTVHIIPELIEKSVYGLAEIYPDKIKNAKLIANPGCYPTGILLALIPLIENQLIQLNTISINSYSGVSGVGKSPVPGKNMFLDAFNNIIPYKINVHQHIPEIEEQLALSNHNNKVVFNFIPNVASMEDGILSTIFVQLNAEINLTKVLDVYKRKYNKSQFVKLITDRIPEIKDVVDTNYCLIHPVVNEKTNTLMILSLIDNRIKGGSGQAIQNMNLMLGFPEETGLI